ncbi:RecX family transcriptional regulator [Trueperella pecoris]|uniref:Regulatory protein RecX n=1 Tax=Trueperella pecoris TaxID=2733571 RepID=A0A7M1R2U4_9ACTO|nr:regulatory protein RecX [Trueperella pecoris]QOR48416.1 RecX family transcriptional regulator [Trueperella pecoris]
MVNYAEEADFVGKQRRRRSAQEIAARKAERAAARNDEQWRSYARDLCYRQLAMMERSCKQLADAMERNLVPQQIADETLQAFVDANLVNDQRYADAFVRSKFAGKTTSRKVLRQELERKGISGEIAAEALEQIDSQDEAQAATDFAVRRIRSMRHLSDEVRRRRLYGALGRRGFSSAQIRNAIETAFAQLEADE